MLYKLNKKEWKEELKNVFVVKENVKLINNKNIFLIDDIFIIGLIINEIFKFLKLLGVNKVFVLILFIKVNDNYIME